MPVSWWNVSATEGFAEVLEYHEAVDGGRGAEGGDAVFLYLAHDLLGGELLVVVDEHGGPGEPLAVELAPHGLAPSRVGHGEVDAVGGQVVPEDARGEVAEGVEVVVGHHLGLSAGAAGEVDEHRVLVGVDVLGADEAGCLGPLLPPVVESLGHGLALLAEGVDGHEHLHRGAVGHGGEYLAGDVLVVGADDGLDAGPLVAVYDVVLGEHVGGGYGHGAQLVEGEHAEPPLVVPLEDEHHLVAMAYAEALEVGGGAVGLVFQLREGGSHLLAPLAGPEEGELVGVLLCPRVHHVVGEVEVLGYLEVQVSLVVLLGGEAGLREKSLYHGLGFVWWCV